jgi:diguanylate cyclase (GGDEF)-like protein
MRSILSAIRRALPSDGEPYEDGPLPDLISGAMWFATGSVGLAVQALPGVTENSELPWVWVLGAFAIGWGGISVLLGLRGKVMPLGRRAVVTAAMMPVVAVALWATGGATSYLQPVLLFSVLFVSWFFQPRQAATLVGLLIVMHATPLLYDPDALTIGYAARAVIFTVTVTGLTLCMLILKQLLVGAEMRQRENAERDALTGIANRRGFDYALKAAHKREERYALIMFDFDDFKRINDQHGHPVGDAALVAVAHAARELVRDGDCLARFGGDEFALIAPGSGERGAVRLVRALGEAIHAMQLPGVGSVGVTFAWALAPVDATDPNDLMKVAFARLLARKRERRHREAVAAAG